MAKYMEEKYLLIKTSILEAEEIKDNLCSKCVELTEEELEYMTEYADEYNYKTPDLEKKLREVLNDEKD